MENKKDIPLTKRKTIKHTGLKRDTTDKFYTKNSISEMCLNIFKKYVKVGKKDIVIEQVLEMGFL